MFVNNRRFGLMLKQDKKDLSIKTSLNFKDLNAHKITVNVAI